jgi:hypothetical protein
MTECDEPPESNPAALEARQPGEDPEEPYEDVDIETLPDWWREGIELHREYGLRPYRPPRFADGAFTQAVVADLETDLGVDIRLSGFDAQHGDDWTLLVDGEAVATLPRQRSANGYTVYDLPSAEFERLVREAAD